MNESQLQQAANISATLAARWFPHLSAAMAEFGISNPLDIAMFIAQIGTESSGFTRVVENLNYAATALPSLFPSRITVQQANSIGRTAAHPADQKAIANLIYGGAWGSTNLGNTQTGDGWLYRGRGLKQLTGRYNYLTCGRALGVDLITSPQLLETDALAARSAAWFFVSKHCLNFTGDVERCTRIINGGTNGMADRKARYALASHVLTRAK